MPHSGGTARRDSMIRFCVPGICLELGLIHINYAKEPDLLSVISVGLCKNRINRDILRPVILGPIFTSYKRQNESQSQQESDFLPRNFKILCLKILLRPKIPEFPRGSYPEDPFQDNAFERDYIVCRPAG